MVSGRNVLVHLVLKVPQHHRTQVLRHALRGLLAHACGAAPGSADDRGSVTSSPEEMLFAAHLAS